MGSARELQAGLNAGGALERNLMYLHWQDGRMLLCDRSNCTCM